jgi:PAS domain S-box-containing protein
MNNIPLSEKWREKVENQDFTIREKVVLQDFLDVMPLPVIITGPDLAIRYVNPAFIRLTGFSQLEVEGARAPYPWWPPAYHQEYLAELGVVKAGRQHKSDWLFNARDGHQFWIKASVAPVIEDAQVRYLVACWTDITANKTSESALQNQLDRLNSRGATFRLA